MEDQPSFLSMSILCIILLISITLIILDFVWLFPVMNNSKKEEPIVEIESLLKTEYNTIDLSSFSSSKVDCEKNLFDMNIDGVYETFDFKMKKIHKYSTGLVSILFIQIGIDIIYLLWICISFIRNSIFSILIMIIIYLILPQIGSLLNLIFFILLSVYYYKGRIDDFKYFSECYFFDETNFNKNYDYIFLVYKNCKKVFIVNLIYLCIICCSIFINFMKCLFSIKFK